MSVLGMAKAHVEKSKALRVANPEAISTRGSDPSPHRAQLGEARRTEIAAKREQVWTELGDET